MPSDLRPHADWIKRTASIGHPRSKELKAVDDALQRYEQFGGGDAQWRLGQALDAWKRTHGTGDEWKSSSRNKNKVVEELTTLLTGKDTDARSGLVPDFMHPDMINSRLGVVYLFGNMDARADIFSVVLEGAMGALDGVLGYQSAPVKDGGLGNLAAGAAAMNIKTVMVPGSVLLNASVSSGIGAPTDSKHITVWEKVKAWLTNFASKLLETLKEKFGDPGVTISAVKNLINVLAKVFLENAAPFISAGMDIAKGVVNTIDASFVRFRSWYEGRKVELAQGHPGLVVQSINLGMTLSLFEGLYQTLKGSVNAAATGFTAGASLVINLLVSLGEMIIKVVWRLVELSRMRKFFAQASEHWRNHDSANAIHKHPIAFSNWYRSFVIDLPPLAILTLNSGICGDKMIYLSMFTSAQEQISSAKFEAGAKFLDNLKPWGAEYLQRCGFEFSSSSEQVSSLLVFSAKHADPRNKAWAMVRKIANA